MKPALATAIATLGLSIGAGPSVFASTAILSDAGIKAAIEKGWKDAQSGTHGFMLQEHVLFDVPDPVSITPGEGDVEAVIVGTPRQMLAYRSYLAAIQGKILSRVEAQAIAEEVSATVHFIIFAHAQSGDPEDRDFLKRFGHFRFTTGAGGTLSPATLSTVGPSKDFYTLSSHERTQRWLGTQTVGFSLRDLRRQGVDISTLKGTLSFSDGSKRLYTLPVDLAKYE